MKKIYTTPYLKELDFVDVLAESGDNVEGDGYDDGWGDESDFGVEGMFEF